MTWPPRTTLCFLPTASFNCEIWNTRWMDGLL
uniref:Uncharacterized protein n=1 Tax=Arundo donax TaxID=35708 RepID=A0A0A9CDS4_ARUDO